MSDLDVSELLRRLRKFERRIRNGKLGEAHDMLISIEAMLGYIHDGRGNVLKFPRRPSLRAKRA